MESRFDVLQHGVGDVGDTFDGAALIVEANESIEAQAAVLEPAADGAFDDGGTDTCLELPIRPMSGAADGDAFPEDDPEWFDEDGPEWFELLAELPRTYPANSELAPTPAPAAGEGVVSPAELPRTYPADSELAPLLVVFWRPANGSARACPPAF